jgi:hypothetical protein
MQRKEQLRVAHGYWKPGRWGAAELSRDLVLGQSVPVAAVVADQALGD